MHRLLGSPLLLIALAGCLLAGCTPRHEFTGLVFDDPQPVGELRGTAHTGQPFDLADIQGKTVVVFFGYTFCPDICPLSLANVAGAIKSIADDDPESAQDLVALFVTIDPERDSVERLAQYVPAFHPSILGIAVDPALLDQVKSNFGVFAEKSDVSQSSDAGYLMDHTAGIYVVDRRSNLLALFPHDTPIDALAADLKELLKR